MRRRWASTIVVEKGGKKSRTAAQPTGSIPIAGSGGDIISVHPPDTGGPHQLQRETVTRTVGSIVRHQRFEQPLRLRRKFSNFGMIAAFGEVLIGDPRNDRDMLQGGMQGTQCHRWIHIFQF
jgi:hypothetical protein